MKLKNLFGFVLLILAAAGSWYLASSLQQSEPETAPRKTFSEGFYLKNARILGTGEQGNLLYEIIADYAEQKRDGQIEFQDVRIRYSPEASVPWTLKADEATIGENKEQVILHGNVRAMSSEGFQGKETEIRTSYLKIEPEAFRAETDKQVRIRIGSQTLTATGMLALLQENRLLLKSNVSGKYVP